MKIGILGGSFDPIHNGHLNMAKSALKEFELDKVWIMPAAHSPNKEEANMTSGQMRLEMCELAVKELSDIEVSDFEFQYQETSYTYMTLQRLCKKYPEDEFYFIMGADSLDYFEKWYHPEIIAKLCTILVIMREGFSKDSMQKKVQELEKQFTCHIRLATCPRYDISSTEIRKNFQGSKSCKEFLPEAVLEYINKNNLYKLV